MGSFPQTLIDLEEQNIEKTERTILVLGQLTCSTSDKPGLASGQSSVIDTSNSWNLVLSDGFSASVSRQSAADHRVAARLNTHVCGEMRKRCDRNDVLTCNIGLRTVGIIQQKNYWSENRQSGRLPYIETNHPDGNLVQKYKAKEFDVVGEQAATKYYPNHLSRLKRVEKLHCLKSQPMFSKASQTEVSPSKPFLGSSRTARRPQGKKRCVTSLKTAARESTNGMAPTIWFSNRNFRFFHVNLHESVSVYTKPVCVPNRVLQSRNPVPKFRAIQ